MGTSLKILIVNYVLHIQLKIIKCNMFDFCYPMAKEFYFLAYGYLCLMCISFLSSLNVESQISSRKGSIIVDFPVISIIAGKSKLYCSIVYNFLQINEFVGQLRKTVADQPHAIDGFIDYTINTHYSTFHTISTSVRFKI